MNKYKYIDCHSHPHDIKYKTENIDIDQVLINLKNDGGGTIAIGTDYKLSLEAIELAKKHENVWATIGIHPADNHAEIWDEEKSQKLVDENKEKIVGVGECGLDYFYFAKIYGENWKQALEKREGKFLEVENEIVRQKSIFVKQIEFAIKNNLPIVIHGRPSKNSMDAYRDILDILEQLPRQNLSDFATSSEEGELPKIKGHAHFFVGNLEIAKRFLDIGFLLSFDGPITFTTEYDEVIKNTPIEKMMIETDSPYASPMPHRGKINYPEYVKFVAEKIGKLKNISTEEVLETAKNNTVKLFNL
jgi:TatD DNase family protein